MKKYIIMPDYAMIYFIYLKCSPYLFMGEFECCCTYSSTDTTYADECFLGRGFCVHYSVLPVLA